MASSDDGVLASTSEDLVASSDDGVLASTSEDSEDTRPPWQARNMHFDCVPCFANISQPGGHLPLGQNHVGSLLSRKLCQKERHNHVESLLQNSNWPDNIARAESNRREAITFEGALAPVITSDDLNKFKSFDAQINMDIDSLIHATSDGRRYVK